MSGRADAAEHGDAGAGGFPDRRRVTVWRLDSLPGSETFIRNQIDAMRRWRPTLLGTLRVDSPISRADEPIVFDRSLRDRIGLFLAALTGRSRRIRDALAATRPELVHAHFAKDAWMVRHACRRLRLPLVVTVHGYDVTALPRAAGLRGVANRRRTRAALRGADAVVAVSEFIRAEAIRWGAPAERVHVLPIGIPVGTAGEGDRSQHARPVDVVFLGRMVPKKGVRDALLAIAAQPGATSLACEFIGDGPLRAEAEALAAALGLRVRFPGSLGPEDVASRLRQARVLLAPSQTAPDGDSEGFGMVFLEAALAGVPTVAYRHGGVPEAVADGATGLLAPESDLAALSDRLGRLLADEDLRAQMAERAARRVREHYDVAARTVALEALYDAVARR